MNRTKLVLRNSMQILNEDGGIALFKHALWFVRKSLFLFQRYDIYETSLNADVPIIQCDIDGLEVKMITTPEEVDKLLYDGFPPSKFSRDKEIINKGAILFFALVGKELVHVTQVFIGIKAHEIYPFSFAMQCGHTIGLAGRTIPKYRRRGIHVYTRFKALQYLRARGFFRAWDVQNGDVAARNAVLKLGYYFWGNGYYLRLLSLLIIKWTKPKSPLASRSVKCSWGI